MNYKNLLPNKLFRLAFISAGLLFFSLETTAQTQPTAAVGTFQSGSKIPKIIFKSLPGIGVYVKDVVLEIKYTVTSYTLKLVDAEGNIKQVQCQRSAFSTLAKQYINDHTKPGDAISIQNIKAKDEGGSEVKLPALVYYIE